MSQSQATNDVTLTMGDAPLFLRRAAISDEMESLKTQWGVLNPTSDIGFFGGTVKPTSLVASVENVEIQERYKKISKELESIDRKLGAKKERIEALRQQSHALSEDTCYGIGMALAATTVPSLMLLMLGLREELASFLSSNILFVTLALISVAGFIGMLLVDNARESVQVSSREIDVIAGFDQKLAARLRKRTVRNKDNAAEPVKR